MSSQQDMLKLAEEFLVSGVTQKEFCQKAGIKPSTFSYWMKKVRSRDRVASGGFIKISTEKTPSQAQELELSYPNGVKVKISTSEIALISRLVKLY